MTASVVAQVRERYSLCVAQDYADRVAAASPAITAEQLYQRALNENIKQYTETSVLPYGAASQVAATLPNSVVLQISTSRDATQPLRPCADTTDEEAVLNAALQKNTSHRLLRLVLTDGVVEIPAFELSTLRVFNGIPIPGQKLLIKSGADIRNGAIIMTDDNTVLLGGEVQQLKQEFLAHRRQMEGGYPSSGGLEGVPRFQPLNVGQHYNPRPPSSVMRGASHGGFVGPNQSRPPRGRGHGGHEGPSHERGRGRGRGGGGGRGGRGTYNDPQHDGRGYGRGRGQRGGRGTPGDGGRGGGHYHNDPNGAPPLASQPYTAAAPRVDTRPPPVTANNYPSLW